MIGFFKTAAVVVTAWVLTCGPAGAKTPRGESPSRITDEYIPLQTDAVPHRPRALEIGDKLLGSGTIAPGFSLPTGAVWQPSLMLFGTLRTALQTHDNGQETFTEWSNRADLFTNLRLSGTERLLMGIRALDKDGRFTGYHFEPGTADHGWQEEFNVDIRTFFFEGDVGEIFPGLDPDDVFASNVGFSVGRQPLFIQEGMLVNDTMDSIGVVFNAPAFPGAAYWKITTLYGWDGVNRDNNREDGSAQLAGLFNELEFKDHTVNVDLVYINADGNTGDGFYAGISSVQRMGRWNTAFRINSSWCDGDDEGTAVSRGTLLFSEVSLTPQGTRDLFYINGFWGFDQFASASRDAAVGGPLGRTGILFAAVGMGRYKPALGNRADHAVGCAAGYQMLFKGGKQQVIVEAGARTDTDGSGQTALAAGIRYQHALTRRIILQLDGFAADKEASDRSFGARTELKFKF